MADVPKGPLLAPSCLGALPKKERWNAALLIRTSAGTLDKIVHRHWGIYEWCQRPTRTAS